MIPLQLNLKNFLSYREAKLDFRGLHTACICGANGAGKSSLLEAIAWVLWGESRANSDDDVIHNGTTEVQVDFTFSNQGQIYRVIRGRQRGQSTLLEFQIGQGEEGDLCFRSITEKGLRSTQQLIIQHLKLDYDTFINSAYLRQGRADEFMLKRPSERKQVLADLLKLDQYDQLAEQAREKSRQLKAELEMLEQTLAQLEQQLQQTDAIAQEQAALETLLADLQQQQQADQTRYQELQALQQQRHTWEQQVNFHQQHQHRLSQDCQQLQQELASVQQQQATLDAVLQQGEAIAQGYAYWLQLQTEDEHQTELSHQYQQAHNQRQQVQQQLDQQLVGMQNALRQAEAEWLALEQQEQELTQLCQRSGDLDTPLANLQQARSHLQMLDRLHTQVAPLLQQRDQLQRQLEFTRISLTTRLEELQMTRQQLASRQTGVVHLLATIEELDQRLMVLEQRRHYQQQVRDKGMERRSFMDRLQAQQREYETQLAQLDQKIQLLKRGEAAKGEPTKRKVKRKSRSQGQEHGLEVVEATEQQLTAVVLNSTFPPCPLCDRPLDEHHWQLVMDKHQSQQQDVLNQLWVLREQLVVSEREIQVLRQEYRTVEAELGQYGWVMERRGQLQQQLADITEQQQQLAQTIQATTELEALLQSGQYAPELQQELALLDQQLAEIYQQVATATAGAIVTYDDREHALARSEVDRWRWAEIRQAEIRQAQRRQAAIAEQKLTVAAQITTLQQQLEQWLNPDVSPLAAELQAIDQHLASLEYDPNQHHHLRQTLRQAQPWQLQYQTLTHAQQQAPVIQQRLTELQQRLAERLAEQQAIAAQLDMLQECLNTTPDPTHNLTYLSQQIHSRRSELDAHLARCGQLQAQQQHLISLRDQYSTLLHQRQTLRHQHRIHTELAQAFGKNGIQALLIENVLPQLEAETNQILSRLSANQFHVQFVTQRTSRRDQGRTPKAKQPLKLIETLDILIADSHGTRAYETYSGGEAFRINFAIRLALARLLAQRTGAVLQMLIIDEGFGTQDAEGCDRLIAAITAIANDFSCILTVTHIPHLREAFQTRIEVHKTSHGSQLEFIST